MTRKLFGVILFSFCRSVSSYSSFVSPFGLDMNEIQDTLSVFFLKKEPG
jgi:hypothetical protein